MIDSHAPHEGFWTAAFTYKLHDSEKDTYQYRHLRLQPAIEEERSGYLRALKVYEIPLRHQTAAFRSPYKGDSPCQYLVRCKNRRRRSELPEYSNARRAAANASLEVSLYSWARSQRIPATFEVRSRMVSLFTPSRGFGRHRVFRVNFLRCLRTTYLHSSCGHLLVLAPFLRPRLCRRQFCGLYFRLLRYNVLGRSG